MEREFVSFDEDVIDSEYADLAKSSPMDEVALLRCIERYETCGRDDPSPALIKTFDEGFKEIRHIKSKYKGRMLYYERPKVKGEKEILIELRVFRKETQETPLRDRRTAEARMKAHKKAQEDK